MALPLGWGGFVFAAVPVFGFAALIALLTFALFQDRYIESHDAIRSSEWRLFEVPTAFQVELPGAAIATSKPLISLNVGGIAPSSTGWVIERDGAYFYAGVLQYPVGTTPKPEILERMLAAIKAENPKRYVYGDERLAIQGRTGREFKFTRPYTTVQIYLDGQRLYFLATDWHVQSDSRKFFGSFRID